MTRPTDRLTTYKSIAELVTMYAKWGSILTGGFCLLLYSNEIGQFPEGMNLGEGLAFYLVCAGFLVVSTFYAAVTTAMGSLLLAGPILLHKKFIRGRSQAKSSQSDLYLLTDYSLMWETPVIALAVVGFLVWFFYVASRPTEGVIFLAQPLAQGVLVTGWLMTRQRLRLLQTGLVFPSEGDDLIERKKANIHVVRKALLIAFVTVPLLLAPDRMILVDAAFRMAQLRKDSAIIHVKKPWANRVEVSTLTPEKSFLGDEYVTFEKIKVLLRSVGSKVVIELPQAADKPATRLSIPSEAIFVE